MRLNIGPIMLGCLVGLLATQPATATVVISAIDTTSGGLVTNQLTSITGRTNLPGDDRLFMTTKNGRIGIYRPTVGTFSTFLDLSSSVVNASNNELGMLGLTFDPGYKTNGYLYAFLTTRATPEGPVEARVQRFVDPAIAAGASSTVWTMNLDGATTHIGGWIDFDATGKLLIAVGDGGKSFAPDIRSTGQNPADWFGSILRIDPHADDFADPLLNYGIPSDNPAIAGAAPELFAYGLRNPFRNSVAPDGSLIIADVGHNDREEITVLGAADPNRNLGWALREGDIATPGISGPLPPDYQAPDLVYDHSLGRAVIGGFVYRGTAVPELFGRYVFGDEVSGDIWSAVYSDGKLLPGTKKLLGNIPSLTSFGETADGELVATRFAFGTGALRIFAITSDGVRAPVPEPASWAMMIAGLAMAGGMLRQRRGLQAARRPV